jgi:hypothetical protein
MELTHVIANISFNIRNPNENMHFLHLFHFHIFGKGIVVRNTNSLIHAWILKSNLFIQSWNSNKNMHLVN